MGGQENQIADPSTTQEQIDDSFLSAAKTSEASGDYLGAAGYWQGLLDREPTNLEASIGLADSLRRLGEYDRALDVLRSALANHADDAQLLSLYGRTLVQSGDAADSIAPLERATEQDATSWETFAALGVAYGVIDQHDKANEANLRALALSPSNPNVLNNMGLEAAMDGNLDTAIDLLERAAEQDGADMTVRQNLALLLAYRGDLTRAEQLARQDLPEQLADRNVIFYKSLSDEEVESIDELVNQSQLRIEEEPLAVPDTATQALALNDAGAPVATQLEVVVPEEEVVVPAAEIVASTDAEAVPADDGDGVELAPVVVAPEPQAAASSGEDEVVAPAAEIVASTDAEAVPADDGDGVELAPVVVAPEPQAAASSGEDEVVAPAVVSPESQASDDGALAPQRLNVQTNETVMALPSAESVDVTEAGETDDETFLEMIGSITAPAPEAGQAAAVETVDPAWQRRSNDRGSAVASTTEFDPGVLGSVLQPSEPIAVQGEAEVEPEVEQ